MDEGYKNVSLDQALLPGADNPLQPSQYIPSTAISTLDVVVHSNTSFPAPISPNASSSTTVQHALGYNPQVVAYVSFTSTGTPRLLPHIEPDAVTGLPMYLIDYECIPGGVTFFHRYFTTYVNQTNYIDYRFLQGIAR